MASLDCLDETLGVTPDMDDGVLVVHVPVDKGVLPDNGSLLCLFRGLLSEQVEVPLNAAKVTDVVLLHPFLDARKLCGCLPAFVNNFITTNASI